MAFMNRGNRDKLAALAGRTPQNVVQPAPQMGVPPAAAPQMNGRQQGFNQLAQVGQQYGLSDLQGGKRKQLRQIFGAASGAEAGANPWRGMSNRDMLSALSGMAPPAAGTTLEASGPGLKGPGAVSAGGEGLMATTGPVGIQDRPAMGAGTDYNGIIGGGIPTDTITTMPGLGMGKGVQTGGIDPVPTTGPVGIQPKKPVQPVGMQFLAKGGSPFGYRRR